MRNFFRTAAAMLAAACIAAACNDGGRFHVEGNIEGAKDSVLYFENMSLDGLVTVDSVRLGEDGEFSFSDKAPAAPEFYRLRIAGQIINVSVDSTETVNVKAHYDTMATGYEVTGSDNCTRIRELALKQIDLYNRAMALEKAAGLSRDEVRDSLMRMIEAYKEDVTLNYIFKEPKAASSYFALFQTLGDYLIFNPKSNGADIRVFAAVATSWDTYYPDALRGANLHNIALEGMKNARIVAEENSRAIDPAKVVTAGLIDLELKDSSGRTRRLSDLKGKVVLLDFHLFSSTDSPKRILVLRDLYNKYHDRGLEIYQVGVDSDEHYWQQRTAALPWVSVLAPDGLDSKCLAVYNVRAVPEFFLIDRDNNLVSRSEQMKDVEAEIEKLL